MSLIEELKRRHVFKVGFAYLVIAWLIAQVLDLVLGTFEIPGWAMKTVLVMLAVGFVVALLLAWAYELTPEGVRKDSDATPATRARAGLILNYVIMAALALAASYFFVTREQTVTPARDGAAAKATLDDLAARPSVIVLPFANISGDESHEYLAFGITEELISGLQRLGNFPVVSRNASLSFGVTDVSAVDFAQNHGASYLVEGSVTVDGGGIRVLANLTSAAGNQVWSERYQGDGIEVFDIADQLIAKVAGAVMQSEVNRVQRADRPPEDAWEHYIKGLKVVLAFDHELYEEAKANIEQAIEIAPDMAEAWWALGELEVMNFMTRPAVADVDTDEMDVFIGYFRKAHEISPFHAAACGCLGYMLTAVGRPDEARAVFEEAVEAKPLSPDLRTDYAIYLVWAGRYDEALENADLAMKLGPVSQDRAGAWSVKSMVAFARGEEQASLEAINRALFVKNDTFYTPTGVAMLYLLGRETEAAELYREMRELFPGLEPRNPIFYVTMKPIDDILVARRENGIEGEPEGVAEIFETLRLRTEP